MTRAIPKCSSNGTHFFAHAGGECTIAPESRWHVQAKEYVRDTARQLGYHAQLEHRGGDSSKRWCSDIWITTPATAMAVEVQHSYQHLRDYIRRQRRYEAAGVRCLWLVMEPHYGTLLNAMLKRRYVEEFGRNWPVGENACIGDLPVATLSLEPAPHVRGPRLQVDLAAALTAFLTDRFRWENGAWLVAESASGYGGGS